MISHLDVGMSSACSRDVDCSVNMISARVTLCNHNKTWLMPLLSSTHLLGTTMTRVDNELPQQPSYKSERTTPFQLQSLLSYWRRFRKEGF
jgi:hypothetical protein